MKNIKLNLRTLVILFALSSIFIACSNDDENIEIVEKQEIKRMNSDELLFYNSLAEDLNNYSRKSDKIGINVENPNNFMEGFGIYMQNMMFDLLDSGEDLSLLTSDEVNSKVNNYMIENPIPEGLVGINTFNSDLNFRLSELIKNIFLNDEVNQSIQNITFIENEIIKTNLISEGEKTYMLAYSSVLKHVKWGG